MGNNCGSEALPGTSFSSLGSPNSLESQLFFPQGTVNDDGMNCAETCMKKVNVWEPTLLAFFAAISITSYLIIFALYFWFEVPTLRRHPTSLLVYKCIFEFIFVQQYLWVPSVARNHPHLFFNQECFFPFCSASNFSRWLAFTTQFSILAAELCLAVLSIDLRRAYTNPFSSYKQTRTTFAGAVLFISLVMACFLMMLGPLVYGPSAEGVVWIQNRNKIGENGIDSVSTNWSKFILFYFLMFIIYAGSLWANWILSRKIRLGFSDTLAVRMSIINRASNIIYGYAIFWSIVLATEFLNFVLAKQRGGNRHSLSSVPAYIYCCRGLVPLIIIMATHWSELTWKSIFRNQGRDVMVGDVVQEGLTLKPHLNTALRAEILYFTTQGIMFAAKEHSKDIYSDDIGRRTTETQHNSVLQGNDDTEFRFGEKIMSYGGSMGSEGDLESLRDSTVSVPDNPILVSAAALGPVVSEGKIRSSIVRYSDGNNGNVGHNNSVTASEISRLKTKQNVIVAGSINAELEEEFHDLGIKPSSKMSISSNSSKSSTYRDISIVSSSSIANRPDSTISYKSHSSGINNRIEEIEMDQRNQRLRNSNPTRSQFNSKFNESDSDLKMIPNSTDRRERDSNNTNESFASDDTVKWSGQSRNNFNDDVEFKMTQPGQNNKNELSNSPSWHRILSTTNRSSMSANNLSAREEISISENRSSKLTRIIKDALHSVTSPKQSSDYNSFTFKDFRPKVFAEIRYNYGIDSNEYADSFTETTRQKFSEGRSGAFMFCSKDNEYLVKTLNRKEMVTLLSILPLYKEYLSANPNSQIVKFLGAHRITMYGQKLYFAVMKNVTPSGENLTELYDLKGSWVNRHGNSGSRLTRSERMRKEGSTPVYQDNDLYLKISLDHAAANNLADQIRRDVAFMKDLNLMDYSLLIGVRRCKFEVVDDSGSKAVQISQGNSSNKLNETPILISEMNPFKQEVDGGMRALTVEGPGMYYFGIIDILQEWNWMKKLERFAKMYFRRNDGDGISAMEPHGYAERFLRRVVMDTFEGVADDDNSRYDNVRKQKVVASSSSSSGDVSDDGSIRSSVCSEGNTVA